MMTRMTIPSRPAPAPPGSRAQTAAAGANASIEQLRLQLQQQHKQQQQNGGVQKLTIKLPPPPKGSNNNFSQSSSSTSSNSSITRKFPQARYTPTTNWDDSPFDEKSAINGNFKKVPPPRPPPPKVQVTGHKVVPPQQSTNVLSKVFQRKKAIYKSQTSAAAAEKQATATRVYGVSSGKNYSSTANFSNTMTTTTAMNSNSSNNVNWNAAWDTNTGYVAPSCPTYSTQTLSSSHFNSQSVSTTTATNSNDIQLISFDSPPSSPTFTQKSNSDCVSVDSFSSDSNFSSPNNGSVSQPESGFEDDFSATRSRPPTTSPYDPWESIDAFGTTTAEHTIGGGNNAIGTAPVRNLNTVNSRLSTDNPLCNGKSLLPPAPTLNMPTIIKPKISQKPKAPKPPILYGKPQLHVSNTGGPHTPPSPPSPPMPKCPPPPPPTGYSLLDVISGKVDAIHLSQGPYMEEEPEQPYGVALYDFEGVEDDDLSFRENEKIYLLEEVASDWFRGRTRAGCEGLLPANYIDIKVPLSTNAKKTENFSSAKTPTYQTTSTTTQNRTINATTSSLPRVRCMYNFPAEVEGDLVLKENDLVTILYRINEDWLYGEIDGRCGQFPANFLEYVPDNIPLP